MTKKITIQQYLMIVFIAAVGLLFWTVDGSQYLNLDYIQRHLATLKAYYVKHTVSTLLIFFVSYVIVIALSIPGAIIMTLLAGALFGVVMGAIVVSFASTLGATLAFLASRYLLRDAVQTRFGNFFDKINAGVNRDGSFYLFSLRLIPAFPFVVINLLMGLTTMRIWTYYWVSQLGMLPGTIIYTNAGRALGSIESLSEVASPTVIGAFVLLGLFPWLVKGMLRIFHRPSTL